MATPNRSRDSALEKRNPDLAHLKHRTPDALRPAIPTAGPVSIIGNPSGWRPLEYRVIVLPDTPAKLSAGGIHVPDEVQDREWHAQHIGRLVAAGGKAFGDWPEEERQLLRPGVRVHINRYQGLIIEGRDGRKYREMNDKDILAVEIPES